MTNREKQAFLNAVGRVKTAAYLVKLAKLGKLNPHKCRYCGSSAIDPSGNCRRCRGAITKQAVLRFYGK